MRHWSHYVDGDYAYCNNPINGMMAAEFPHDFSICDIDGTVRKHYMAYGQREMRFLITEVKKWNEPIHGTQEDTLLFLSSSLQWEKCDNESGVYIVKHSEHMDSFDVYDVYSKYHKYTFNPIELHNWYSPPDMYRESALSNQDRDSIAEFRRKYRKEVLWNTAKRKL